MYPSYYALRRVNPYRGVVQIVEAGEVTAHSFDGLTWHLRADDGYGWVRPTGIWVEGEGLKAGHAENLGDILPALETRPALPFPIVDTQELWLLDQESGLPLALLACDREGVMHNEQPEGEWQPFVPSFTGFHSPSLAEHDASGPSLSHRDLLARQVNQAAGSEASAQWFQRDRAGEGVGCFGLRIPVEWQGRRLPVDAFPELLLRETGNSRLENSVIADYHARLAPILLSWPRISVATRTRLEILACEKPQWLARIHRLLPSRVDAPRIQAALVAARLENALEQAADGPEQDWN
ncbi:MAG: hypothetical protein Q8Q28_08100 [Pseudomonadota bacterium]|nr:hypothetical protein [Pseudomonadota bacterium]